MSGSQISLFKDFKSDELQSYINTIQEIQYAQNTTNSALFDALQVEEYAAALSNVEASQAALLLSTQGITNAQIQQTLATQGLSSAEQYKVMVEAGLLKSKTSLTNAELQNIIATRLGNTEDAKALMSHLGLSVAIEGEEAQTVQLTSKKMKLLAATNLLTVEQAQEIAMITGVTIATKAQSNSVLPQWIAKLKASTAAIWAQVKATAAWLVTNPIGWCILAVTAIASVTTALIYNSKAAERAQKKINELKDDYSESLSELKGIENELSNINQRIEEIHSKGKISFTDAEELQNLQKQRIELERQLTYLQEINKQKANNVISEIRENDEKLNKNFDKDLGNYLTARQQLEDLKAVGLEELSKGTITQENYDATITAYEENLNDYYGNLLESIEEFESNKEAILNKYNGDASAITDLSDKQLYDDITNKLQNSYREIYSKSEYNKLYIEPIFKEEALNGLQQQLVDYFINGGSLDINALEEKFGYSIIEALKNACNNAGMELDALLEELFNQATQTSYGFAPIPTSINNQYDAQQHANSTQKLNYYNSLDDETRSLIINAEIPEDVKKGTIDDFKEWIEDLRKEAKIDVEVEMPDITSPLSDIKEAYSSFESIFNEIESGATVSASSIDDLTDKFGEINGGESLENFKEVLTTMPDDINACKEALNQLATDYLDQSDLIQNLTDDNAEYTESELKKLGVENAHEVVQSRLIQHDYTEADAKAVLVNYANQLTDAKEKERIASLDLTNVTAQEIAKIIEEANAAGISTTALQRWLLEKMQANKITISTNGDIQNLMSLVSALGSATTYIQKYAEAKAKLANGGTLTGNATADRYALDALEKGAQKELQDALNGATNANVNYTGGGSSTGSGSGSGSSSASEAKETAKQYDWIAISIQRCKEARERLNKVESNDYTGWSKRNTALNSEISEITKEISLQQQAYDGYMANANAVGLSQDYINKIQNGTIAIEDITDEGLQEQIDQYQEWYEKAIECSDEIQDLNINLSELAEQKFDNVVSQFEDLEGVFTSLNDRIEASIDLAEAKGRLISKSYYEEMIKSETENNKLLKQQQAEMVRSFNEAVSSGRIEEGSEAFYDMQDKISDVNKAIIESNTSLQEFNNSIRELDWEIFDLIQDKITNLADEIEFMTSLLENEKLTDGKIDRGLTSEGIAQLGNYASQYNIYMSQAEKYSKEIREIEMDIANDPANQDLINRKQELVEAQQDVILSANEEKQAMIDLARDGYNAVLESLQELIDKRKEDLNSTKELYEYQQKIAEKTKNIASIKKQLSVVENDNSEEAKKTIQQLRVELSDAEQDLKDTEYEKYISDQENMLDDFYQEYSDKIDEKFEQLDILFQELIDIINANSESINNTLSLTAEEVGYTMSKELTAIWGDTGTVIANFSGKFDTYSTTIQSVLSGIKTTIDSMLKIAQDEANAAIAAAQATPTPAPAPAQSAPAESTPAPTPAPASTAPSTPSVGDKITNASGRWYVDSYGSKAGSDVNKYAPDYFMIDKISSGRAYPYHIQAYKNGKASGGNGWVKGSQIGYKTGLKESMYDHWAITQEEGAEMIRTPSGELLTPIPKGTSVFTRDMTNNLWDFAGNPKEFIKELYQVPSINFTGKTGGNVEINIENMALPNVKNPEDFANGIVDAIQNNSNVVKAMQSVTVDHMVGYNSKRINRF